MRGFQAPLTLAFLAHAFVIAGSQFPADSALGAWLAGATRPYLIATGSWQSWDMFDSAPRYHAYQVVIVAHFANGTVQTFPPLLPFLIEQSQNVRDNTFFLRVLDGSYSSYLDGYAQSACNAIETRIGTRPTSVATRQYVEVLRALADIRRDGLAGQSSTIDGDPMLCRSRLSSD